MADLGDGESTQVKGSGSSIYTLKNVGGVYSCSCPAWRNQSVPIERRTCKHLKAYRGEEAELARAGAPSPRQPVAERPKKDGAEPVVEPPLLLAERWESDVELEGWWMSEKLDGVRAYWNGKEFISRLGNRYLAPDWFLEKLPAMPLDGELWSGRKLFQRTTSIVRRQDKNDLWREVKYLVFDAPALADPFERRMEACKEALSGNPPFAALHPHERCGGADHLKAELARVTGLGGEGLMLRKPGSLYQVGRSSTLLKVKTFYDSEATVLEHQPGAGRHKGRLGALLVQLPDGTRFSVGTGLSDAERERPPPVGSVITFRYQELSEAGVPRFPSYIGVRAEGRAPAAAPAPPAQPRAEPPEPRQGSAAPGVRRFELADGDAAKFWEVEVRGNAQIVHFGRLGASGRTLLKEFVDGATAARETQKLIDEKTRKGYVER